MTYLCCTGRESDHLGSRKLKFLLKKPPVIATALHSGFTRFLPGGSCPHTLLRCSACAEQAAKKRPWGGDTSLWKSEGWQQRKPVSLCPRVCHKPRGLLLPLEGGGWKTDIKETGEISPEQTAGGYYVHQKLAGIKTTVRLQGSTDNWQHSQGTLLKFIARYWAELLDRQELNAAEKCVCDPW